MKQLLSGLKIFIIFFALLLSTAVLPAGAGDATAPNFALYDINSKRHVFYDVLKKLPSRGRLILNFTSVYCAPCKKEIPALLSIVAEKKAHRLLCVYAEAAAVARAGAKKMRVLSHAFVDPFGAVRKRLSVEKIPVTLVISKQGRILGRFTSYNEKNIADLKKLL